MRKRILAGATLILAVGGVIIMTSDSYAWVKDDIQGPVLESVSATFNITDMNIAQKAANDDLLKAIEGMEKALKDIKSPAAKKQLKRLKRRWQEDHKRLNNAIHTRQQMLARMAKRKTVTML